METFWCSPVAGVVLAAGRGSRLAPLTRERPKPLCPVGNKPLVDLALGRLVPACGGDPAHLAVNLHHGAVRIDEHLATSDRWSGVHRSCETEVALGTAGALTHLRGWLDGRAALVVNADAWTTADPGALAEGWDGEQPWVHVIGGAFGPGAHIAAALIPWSIVAVLPDGVSGLYAQVWGPHHEAGTLGVLRSDAPFIDCGTPSRYLKANMAASGGSSVVDPLARVAGSLERSVVWAGAEVARGERLVDAIRTTAGQTLLVR